MAEALYDRIGADYATTRRQDPRIAKQIWGALGDARSVADVGSGTGAYEPNDCKVIAIEPSRAMIAQRPASAAPVIQGVAEEIPLPDKSVDVAMAILSLHHWRDWRRGLAEMRRVASRRIVVLTWDPAYAERFWLLRDYLPELARRDVMRFPAIDEQAQVAGDANVSVVPIPHDCVDGFGCAFWRRPAAYLDPRVRAGISTFHLVSAEDRELTRGLTKLADDLDSGRWHRRNGELLNLDELDLGYRLLRCDL